MMSEQKVTNYSVPVIFEPPCIFMTVNTIPDICEGCAIARKDVTFACRNCQVSLFTLYTKTVRIS